MKSYVFIFMIIAGLVFSNNFYAQGWEQVSSGTTFRIFDIHFPEGQSEIGYAACMDGAYDDPGQLLKTEDTGETWTQILPVSGSMDGLECVFFTSVDTGFIGGWNDYFAMTTDGGDSWTDLTLSTSGKVFRDIEFWDSENGVALCRTPATWDAFVYVTDDGGTTWTEATGESHGFACLTYSDANTLFAVGAPNQSISRSTDGGNTWSLNHTGNPTFFLLGVDFEGDYGVAVGQFADTYITTDQGENWTYTSQSTGDNFEGIYVFNSDSTIFGGMNEVMYKTVDGGSNWTVEYDGSGSNYFYTIFFTDKGWGFAGASGGIILRRQASLLADFYADSTATCVETSITYHDNSIGATSWEWTFEGGTPPSSTDQNPVVTYDSPGSYDVELTVYDGDVSDTETKSDYMNIYEALDQPDMPDGPASVCTGQEYNYDTPEVPEALGYEWELSPDDAGILTPDENTASLVVADDWTGEFTLRVRATNICGGGDWSDDLEGTVYEGPVAYNLQGGGSYCLGEDGVEITLDNSDTGIEYELYLNSEATGIIVEGTGSEISFGLVTEEGYYTCIGSNDNCELNMSEQIQVEILYPPTEPAAAEVPDVICQESSSDYTSQGADDADSYVWELTPEDAGSIVATGLEATVEWNAEFSGTAYVSLYGINDCGEGDPSEALEVSVGAPNPVVEGEGLVCDWSEEIYAVEDHAGSSYTWEVTGGTITMGQGTYTVTVEWEGEGSGTIMVSEETADGCEGESEQFGVTIDDCTRIGDNEHDDNLSISPNPATHQVSIMSGSVIEQISIFDQTGQLVKRVDANRAKISVDIRELRKGIYFIKVKTSDRITARRLMVR
ncbi:MAG: T9SS type A sorting domain-containing protein [bacterium]